MRAFSERTVNNSLVNKWCNLIFKVLLLTNFKHNVEDEECPVPYDVRDTLTEFHNDLLLHCGVKIFLFLMV